MKVIHTMHPTGPPPGKVSITCKSMLGLLLCNFFCFHHIRDRIKTQAVVQIQASRWTSILTLLFRKIIRSVSFCEMFKVYLSHLFYEWLINMCTTSHHYYQNYIRRQRIDPLRNGGAIYMGNSDHVGTIGSFVCDDSAHISERWQGNTFWLAGSFFVPSSKVAV